MAGKIKLKVKMLFTFMVCSVTFVTSGYASEQTDVYMDTIKEDNAMDVSDFSVYYDIETNKTIRKMMPRPWYRPGWLLRLPFRGGPCQCDGMQCVCCTGIRIQAFNYDRRTCATLTYEPQNSTLDLDVSMNNASVYRNIFSTRNPPPFCLPIPTPYLPPGLLDMCIRLFDVRFVDQKLHICMDMDTRIDKAPIVILHFDCMDMGSGGVSLSKPEQPSIISTDSVNSTTNEPIQMDSDVYDPVTEISETTTTMFKNSIKYI